MLYIVERHPGTAYFKFQLEGQGCMWEEDTYNSFQFNVNSSFYSIWSTMLSTLFQYNTIWEILTNKQVSLFVTLKIATIHGMVP